MMMTESANFPRNLADLFRLPGNVGSAGPDEESALDKLARQLYSSPPPLFPSPPAIKDTWFKDRRIHIDGYTFERCRFDRCSLITENATFSFKECFIASDCGVFFTGPALKTARLLMHVLSIKARLTRVDGEDAVYATVNPDGTFNLE